jgi:hypothetical protein
LQKTTEGKAEFLCVKLKNRRKPAKSIWAAALPFKGYTLSHVTSTSVLESSILLSENPRLHTRILSPEARMCSIGLDTTDLRVQEGEAHLLSKSGDATRPIKKSSM